ncbi:Hsp70 family protein [Oryzobacter telluris]|uniref:Hsp70 family protein n=1 Tax=Oryzobacter telluris TaxID=3149179 RepID=UPI00370D8800
MTSAGWTLAIDFGTSNTAATIRHDGGPATQVRLSHAADTMPSAVLRIGGGYRVGAAARQGHLANPSGYLEHPKSELGAGTILLGNEEVEVSVLVAEVLRHVTEKATAVAGGTPPRAVILTHPQEWASRRLIALRDAWDLVGIRTEEVRLVPEPVAAVAWFSRVTTIPEGGTVAVFDFGGGTCDVAVLRRVVSPEPDAWPYEVVHHAGRDRLGGNTLDVLLLEHVRRALVAGGEHELVAALSDPAQQGAARTVRDQVRSAKEMLSEYEDAEVAVAVGPHATSVLVTRPEFDDVIADQVRDARSLVVQTLQAAGVEGASLHALYLSGGSSHVPAVHEMLHQLVGRPPSTLGDPKLVVALGAHSVPVGVGERAAPVISTFQARVGSFESSDRLFGHHALWLDCAPHEGEPATITHVVGTDDRVAVGDVVASVTGEGWRADFTSPVAGTVSRLHRQQEGSALPALTYALALAPDRVKGRGLGYPKSYSLHTAAVWRMLVQLGSAEDGAKCIRRLVRLPTPEGPLVDLGHAFWQVSGSTHRVAGKVLVSHGGEVDLGGHGRASLPPAVILVDPSWTPGDPSLVVLTTDIGITRLAESDRWRRAIAQMSGCTMQITGRNGLGSPAPGENPGWAVTLEMADRSALEGLLQVLVRR